MCNCRQLPACVAEIESLERGFEFSRGFIHNYYFETPESELFEPRLDYSQSMYRCMECGQEWYIECSPGTDTLSRVCLKDKWISAATFRERASGGQTVSLHTCTWWIWFRKMQDGRVPES